MEKILKVRIPQKTDTTAGWTSSTLVLHKSEIGVEELDDGTKKFKWGDGIHVWKDLPYATGEALNNILDGIANGSVRTSAATVESADYKLGNAAFAQGQGTKASGNFSHAEGYNTTASGAYSHAEGRQTTALGSVSHAEGTDTVASGIRSHAGGYGTIAKGENQTAIGKYNVQDDNNEFAFIVGNGSSATRSNAFTIDWNGNVSAGGKKLATEEFAAASGGKIDAIKVNGQNLTITDKSVNIEVPTKVSELNNDSGYLTQHQDISGKANLAQVVRHDTTQSLTNEQKIQARANIGAGTSNFDGNYNSLSNKPTIPDVSGLAPKATTLAGYGIGDAYTKTQTDNQIATNIQGLKKADTAVAGKYVSAVSEANGIITVTRADLPTGTDYTVTVTESTPEGYAKAYTITQAATGLNTTINIPRDMVVESGKVEIKTSSGEWGLAGTYLVLTLANATSDRIYIDVSTLIEYVTSGSGANDAIQIAIDPTTHKVTASIKDSSIEKSKLSSAVQASLGKADAAATKASVDSLTTTVNSHTTKLNGIAAGAEVNVQSDWNVTDTASDAFIKNKPTKLSQFTNDSGFLTQHQDISGKANLNQVVRYDAEQSLNNEQKIQARDNIGAGTSNFDGAYSSLTGLPTIPTKTSQLTNDSGFLTSHQSLANYVTLNGTQTISGAKTFSAALTASNGLSVTGNITATGTITGSKVYNAVWNDYAEWFEKDNLEEKFNPGDICVWTGKGVTKAKKLKDKAFVGIISDSYGHILGGEKLNNMEDNNKKYAPIGLKGRVKCNVIGPVEIGDLIVTSELEGIGIVDNNANYNFVVGKALETNFTKDKKQIIILI